MIKPTALLAASAIIAACSNSTETPSEAMSAAEKPNSQHTLSTETRYAQIKKEAINQVSKKFNMDPEDIVSNSIEVDPINNPSKPSFHVIGSFTLSWTQPKNPGEIGQVAANRNICAFTGERCNYKFQHTLYLDLTAFYDPQSSSYTFNGMANQDAPIPKQENSNRNDTESPHRNSDKNSPDKPAKLVSKLIAEYPPQALRQRHEGTSVVKLEIGIDGKVIEAELASTSGYSELDRSALQTAKLMKFSPAYKDGSPQISFIQVPIVFSLKESSSNKTSFDKSYNSLDQQHTPPSFDCAKAMTSTEDAICDSPELSYLDAAMGRLYHDTLNKSRPDSRIFIQKMQRHWLVEREEHCGGDTTCIKTYLQSRINELQVAL